MNVLHYGLILYQPYEISRGLRDIGIRSDCAVWDTCGQEWLMHGVDTNLKMETKTPHEQKEQIDRFMKIVLDEYDIIHFHSRPTFWYKDFSNQEYIRILKNHDKKLFISFWGCDARIFSDDITYSWSPCRLCNQQMRNDCRQINKKTLEISRKYCNTMFSGAEICFKTPDIYWNNLAINIDDYSNITIPEKYIITKKNDEILIYHSFGNSKTRVDVKGSKYIENTIKNLVSYEYKLKYIFIDNVPSRELKYIQCQADIVIDQICAGWYGTTAVECMALGKPVISYLREDNLKICPNKNIPIINANPKTLEDILIKLIKNKNVPECVGDSGNRYVAKYHDRKEVARNFFKYYQEC